MSDDVGIDRLADALEAMLAGPDAPSRLADPELVTLWGLARALRDLPRPSFKMRLASELATIAAAPEAVRSVTVYLAVRPAAALIEFVKRAFDAAELVRTVGSSGGLHAEVAIGDTKLMIGGGEHWPGPTSPTALHLYVPDVDQVYRRALAAGAVSLREPTNQRYGDRDSSVQDAAGNRWYIATHLSGAHVPEGLGSVTPYLHPRGAPRLLEFLQQAFGAEPMEIARASGGTIEHAKLRLGRSVVEMGEAHGDAVPMPTTFYAYVGDVPAAYRRALDAGATSLEEPAMQPYGEMRAAVRDPLDNRWYLAAPGR